MARGCLAAVAVEIDFLRGLAVLVGLAFRFFFVFVGVLFLRMVGVTPLRGPDAFFTGCRPVADFVIAVAMARSMEGLRGGNRPGDGLGLHGNHVVLQTAP